MPGMFHYSLNGKSGKFYFDNSQSNSKSQYGWIPEFEHFSFDEFVKRYAINYSDKNEKGFIKTRLDSVEKRKTETSMATSFAIRCAMGMRFVLTVRKVFFY